MSESNMNIKVHQVLKYIKSNKRNTVIVASIVATVLLVSILFLFDKDDNTNSNIILPNINKEVVEDAELDLNPELVKRHIDGTEVNYGFENLYPVAVMIENLSTVRPQSGLQAANIVYEALAEGGITRFMAIYAGGEDLSEIGPVRSARHYFVEWAEEYGGMYVHAGGSPLALSRLYANEYISDLNQIAGDHLYFWRDNTKLAPHNLFTSSELLSYAIRDNELPENGDYPIWRFVDEVKEKNRPVEEKSILIDFSSTSYSVEYLYDRENNYYLRVNGGIEHVDKLSGEQISVRNIVVQYIPTSLLESDTGRLEMQTVNSGKIIVFNNGQAREGVWEKDEDGVRTRFIIDDRTADFIPGNTWIEILPDDRTIEYN